MPSVEEMAITWQLRWTGHVTCMEDSRLPKAVFYGELKKGSLKSWSSATMLQRHIQETSEQQK